MNKGLHVVFLFVALFVFVSIFYGPWQKLCVDWARQEMFEVRSVLFQLAEQGRWSFTSPEYRKLRIYIETTIRFAHRVSWPRLVFFIYLKSRILKKSEGLHEIIKRIPDKDLRNEVDLEFNKLVRSVMMLLIYRSIILPFILLIVVAIYHCIKPIHGLVARAGWFVYESIEEDAQTLEFAVVPTKRRLHHS